MSQTADTTHPTSEADDIFAECLANARLTALRALLEIINTTDDPIEKRHAANAILRTPDPNARVARVARRSASDSSRVPRHSAPVSSPHLYEPDFTIPPTPPKRSIPESDRLIAAAQFALNDSPFIDPIPTPADLADLSPRPSPAAILAASAGIVPPPLCHNGAP